jgi:endonuclease/exonuclease/phosphatase family metal-dependent hydrolase
MKHTTTFSVASFNVHAGIDGWGRRFDAVAACDDIGADILVVEEDWVADDPADSIASAFAAARGDEIIVTASGRGHRLLPPDDLSRVPPKWAPLRIAGKPNSIRLIDETQKTRLSIADRKSRTSTGMWATSLVSRFPIIERDLVPLPMLPRELARRNAIVARIDVGGGSLVTIVGVHLGHLTHGSPRQMAVLRRSIASMTGQVILAGDLNCWGPPLRVFLRGLHDTVRGPTWPAWRPHSRIDHIMTREPETVVHSSVLERTDSDHLPIMTTFSVAP